MIVNTLANSIFLKLESEFLCFFSLPLRLSSEMWSFDWSTMDCSFKWNAPYPWPPHLDWSHIVSDMLVGTLVVEQEMLLYQWASLKTALEFPHSLAFLIVQSTHKLSFLTVDAELKELLKPSNFVFNKLNVAPKRACQTLSLIFVFHNKMISLNFAILLLRLKTLRNNLIFFVNWNSCIQQVSKFVGISNIHFYLFTTVVMIR